MEATSTIAGLAARCRELFIACVSRTSDDDAVLALESEQRRFRAWASSLDVFAKKTVNLDATLKDANHARIREMITLLLHVLTENLELARDELSAVSTSKGSAVDLKVPLFGIDGSLKRLERLAVALLHAQESSLGRRVQAYREKHRDEEFERLVSRVLMFRFPGLQPSATVQEQPSVEHVDRQPGGLHQALLESVLFRHYLILYERARRRKVSAPVPSAAISSDAASVPQKARKSVDVLRSKIIKFPSLSKHEGTQSDQHTHPFTIDVSQLRANMQTIEEDDTVGPRVDQAPTISEIGEATYPKPPRLAKDAKEATCTICAETLPADTFQGHRWLSHVNHDVKPYVCLSEDCIQSRQYFSSSSEWKQHMRKTHATQWIQSLQNTLVWKCPLCQAYSKVEFASKEKMQENLFAHMETAHPDVTGQDRLRMVSVSGIPRPRPVNICPICGDSHLPRRSHTIGLSASEDGPGYKGKGKGKAMPETSSTRQTRVAFEDGSDEETHQDTLHDFDQQGGQARRDHDRIETHISKHLKTIAFDFARRLYVEDNPGSDALSGRSSDVAIQSPGSSSDLGSVSSLPHDWDNWEAMKDASNDTSSTPPLLATATQWEDVWKLTATTRSKFESPEKELRQKLRLAVGTFGEGSPGSFVYRRDLADWLESEGRLIEAEVEFRRVFDDDKTGSGSADLARVLRRLSRTREAAHLDEEQVGSEIGTIGAGAAVDAEPRKGNALSSRLKRLSSWLGVSSPPKTKVLPLIKESLTSALVKSAFGPSNFFLPCTSLAEIIRPETVLLMLSEFEVSRKLSYQQRKALSERICPSPTADRSPGYTKLLATLIIVGKHESILDFLTHVPPIHDGVSISQPQYNRNWSNLRPILEALPPEALIPFKIDFTATWQGLEVENFARIHLQLRPVFFSVVGDRDSPYHQKVHYSLSPGTVLPFLQLPEDDDDLSNGPPGRLQNEIAGGFSDVTIVQLHPSQQDMKRYTTQGKTRAVAIKRLKSSSKSEFEKERRMLVKLTPLDTPHLAKLLASFDFSTGPFPGSSRTYCLMFEAADGNLKTLWESSQPASVQPGMGPFEVARWVARQCLGIAQGLSMLHDYTYDSQEGLKSGGEGEGSKKGGERLRMLGFHGDIKPENILRYVGWELEDGRQADKDPLGILQLADFGLGSFHDAEEALDIKTRILGHPYRPPESQLFMRTTQSLDIWTLGCLFLDFLTWLAEGPEGLQRFADMRLSPDPVLSKSVYFYDLVEDGQSTSIAVGKGVIEWARHLCNVDASSQFICDFVELMMSRMLVIEHTGIKLPINSPLGTSEPRDQRDIKVRPAQSRIDAKQLLLEMNKLVRDDLRYYHDSPQRLPNFEDLYDESRSIRLALTFTQLKEVGRQQAMTLEELSDEESPAPDPVKQHQPASTLPSAVEEAEGPSSLTPTELKELIESVPPSELLLLDLRGSSLYEKSRIRGALNLPMVTQRAAQYTRKLGQLDHDQTFQAEFNQEKFPSWGNARHLVVYGLQSMTAMITIEKFTSLGFSGRTAILRSDFDAFALAYPALVELGGTLTVGGGGADTKMGVQSGDYRGDLPAAEALEEALATAAARGEIDVVEFMVLRGADINALLQSGNYGSALAAAAARGEIEVVKFLVQQGADVNMPLQSGVYGSALAAAAAARGNIEVVKFLVQQGADVNMPLQSGVYGSALAAAAAARGNIAVVKFLVQQGADVNMPLQSGVYGSALAAAAVYGKNEVVEFLIDHGADPNRRLLHGSGA